MPPEPKGPGHKPGALDFGSGGLIQLHPAAIGSPMYIAASVMLPMRYDEFARRPGFGSIFFITL